MTSEQLLNHCRTKIPWSAMKNILRIHEIPAGQGWNGTIQKLLLYINKGEKEAKHLNALEGSYYEYVITGDKAVRFYNVCEKNIKTLIKSLSNYKPAESIYHNTFPYPLPETQLDQAGTEVTLVSIEQLNEGLALIYCTNRFVTERQEISLNDFSEETQSDLGGYDEIIAIKSHMKQFIDVIVISEKHNMIEVRADLSGGISSEDQTNALRGVAHCFNKLAFEFTGVEGLIVTPLNLFPLVDKLYEAEEEGKVCELGFITDEASIKQQKMRRKEVDMRSETYHQAGKAAVPHLTPFRLGISWEVKGAKDIDLRPELLLPGHFRILNNNPPALYDAIISKCSGFDDYDFVTRKVKEYLK